MDKIDVVNVYALNCEQFCCYCGHIVAFSYRGRLEFRHSFRYCNAFEEKNEDEGGSSNEFVAVLTQFDRGASLFGCVSCSRPIGYGAKFRRRVADRLWLVNAVSVGSSRILCICGHYLG